MQRNNFAFILSTGYCDAYFGSRVDFSASSRILSHVLSSSNSAHDSEVCLWIYIIIHKLMSLDMAKTGANR